MFYFTEPNLGSSPGDEKIHPLLAIIIPHYNSSNTLLRCLSSIHFYLDKHISFEVIIIDDGSDDQHTAAIYELQSRYSFHFILTGAHVGVSRARNIGMQHAVQHSIKYITFVDADDHFILSFSPATFKYSELAIFNSCETSDDYARHEDFKMSVIKENINNIHDMSVLLEAYSKKPNKVPTLTTCWAKIYCTSTIEQYRCRFNEKMHTFEDVDFLMSYLLHVSNVRFIDLNIYAHTNSTNKLTATFGQTSHLTSMFSFLRAARSMRKLVELRYPNALVSNGHFLSCYYSIAFVRLAHRSRSIKDILLLYRFISRRVASGFVHKCFSEYNPNLAGVSGAVRMLVLRRLPLLLTILVFWRAAKRYKLRRSPNF